ncbi:HNH endonuclease [Auraticoccus monumenti]|uniref:HNH nuclease domain-containing protein n=1 Tax=Auraticoccus monumenti TaxID=675864 RepID=A0A1G6YHR5_9ACTN|nr:HNH endonuclease signature motif containing protein [Auraticoccus monumenti]SDD89267.1 protein of unknown function [Auraticoccus monumenti]
MELTAAPALEEGCCVPDLDQLARARRAAAQAEFVLWSQMLHHRDEARAALQATEPSRHRATTGLGSVVLDIAQTLAVSELSVEVILSTADTVRRTLPALWHAFSLGAVDAQRVRIIHQVLTTAHTDTLIGLLDTRAVEYAATHTPAELRAWLKRLRARIEPDSTALEAETARERRRVEIVHVENAMSWVNAYVPTAIAVAIEKRLTTAARTLPEIDPDTGKVDQRTQDQKRADLLCHWLTSSEGTQTTVRAEVAISIDARDLIGLTDGPGTVRGHGIPVPATWVRELATHETTLFRRLVLDPHGQVLDTTSLGYQPPGALRQALQWRDGRCRVAGCQVPADRTDLDHHHPWERGGPTHADNLRSLCRRHHRIKSHGHLTARHYRPPDSYRERVLNQTVVEIDVLHLHAA